MKTSMTLALGAALVAGAAWADRIVVTQDRENALYAAGEEARFSVSVVDDAGVPRKDGTAKWTLDNFGTEKVANGQAALAEGNPFSVTGTLAKPGFLRLRVNSGTNSAVWSVGYDVDRIRQDGTRPSDFDCYWRGEQQRLRREVPLDPTCEKVEAQSRGRWDVFKISFRTFNAKRVWGFMSVPKDRSKAPFRTRVRICDACAGAIGPWEANADEVTVTMNVFDYEPATTNEEQKRRHAEKNAELKGDYYATIPNWRTLKFSYLHWKGFHVDDVWSMHADWPKQFEDTSFVTREVAEFVLIASLCPGAEIPQSRIDILESVFANLDFSRFNQSSGPVHALLAKERLLATAIELTDD